MIELIKPTINHKEDIQKFLVEWNALDRSHIYGASGLQRANSFEQWLHKVNIINLNMIELKKLNRVPQHTFLVYDKNKLIGFLSIRTGITDHLIKNAAGHVRFSVRPTERNKGYATTMLTHAVNYLKELGIKEIFIGCDIHNEATKKVIEKCGGEKLPPEKINVATDQCYVIKTNA